MYNNIALLLGHFVGDYLLQNGEMAIKKSKPGKEGLLSCLMHCNLYSLAIACFVVLGGWRFNSNILSSLGVAYFIAFLCHFPIDRTVFAHKIIKWLKQADFDNQPLYSFSNYHILNYNYRAFFVAPLYIVVDNTLHLVLMWLLLSGMGN